MSLVDIVEFAELLVDFFLFLAIKQKLIRLNFFVTFALAFTVPHSRLLQLAKFEQAVLCICHLL